MIARPPTLHLDGAEITVATSLVDGDGGDLAPLTVTFPSAQADLLDATTTPWVPALVTLAAARGDDLVVQGAVDDDVAGHGQELAALLAEFYGTRTPTVTFESTERHHGTGDGTGLFFTRGIDSWSTLLDLLDAAADQRVTRLVTVLHGQPDGRATESAVAAGHQRVADELGLPLVVIATDARRHLDPLQPWHQTFAPVLVTCAGVTGAGLRRLVMASGSPASVLTATGADPRLLPFMSGPIEVEVGNHLRDRVERAAHVLSDPLARATVQVCWEGGTAENCGRCEKCQRSMAALAAAGDRDPSAAFGGPLDPTLVPERLHNPDDQLPMIAPIVAALPPEHEELRRAWADVLIRTAGDEPPRRWGDDSVPGLAGPSVPQRVAAALRATTGSPDGPSDRPLGWRPGATPLRPRLADGDAIRAAVATAPDRRHPWVVVEHHVRDGRRDGAQADLALRLHDRFGAGPAYLPGILWAPEQPPALGAAEVGRLLGSARSRLWWRDDGDLDPLRVVETIEHGCLPLQVMPTGAAQALRASLPAGVEALVVADSELDDLDLTPVGVRTRLARAVPALLAGSAERDLLIGAHGG